MKSMRKSTLSSKTPCSVKESKALMRARKQAELCSLEQGYIEQSDVAIAQKLSELPQYKNAKTVFVYYSVGREVSTHALIRAAIRDGRRVALPVSGDGGHMKFRLVDDLDGLVPGKFGIPEPAAGDTATPEKDDIIIVPALCCDKYNDRLGHGAGYYDRYLSEHPCFSVCLCRARLLEELIPTENTDARVSMVISDE